MPECPVNEDDQAPFREHQVWTAREFSHVAAITGDSALPEGVPQGQFRAGVLPSDRGHDPAPVALVDRGHVTNLWSRFGHAFGTGEVA